MDLDITTFIREECKLSPQGWVIGKELHKHFVRWHQRKMASVQVGYVLFVTAFTEYGRQFIPQFLYETHRKSMCFRGLVHNSNPVLEPPSPAPSPKVPAPASPMYKAPPLAIPTTPHGTEVMTPRSDPNQHFRIMETTTMFHSCMELPPRSDIALVEQRFDRSFPPGVQFQLLRTQLPFIKLPLHDSLRKFYTQQQLIELYPYLAAVEEKNYEILQNYRGTLDEGSKLHTDVEKDEKAIDKWFQEFNEYDNGRPPLERQFTRTVRLKLPTSEEFQKSQEDQAIAKELANSSITFRASTALPTLTTKRGYEAKKQFPTWLLCQGDYLRIRKQLVELGEITDKEQLDMAKEIKVNGGDEVKVNLSDKREAMDVDVYHDIKLLEAWFQELFPPQVKRESLPEWMAPMYPLPDLLPMRKRGDEKEASFQFLVQLSTTHSHNLKVLDTARRLEVSSGQRVTCALLYTCNQVIDWYRSWLSLPLTFEDEVAPLPVPAKISPVPTLPDFVLPTTPPYQFPEELPTPLPLSAAPTLRIIPDPSQGVLPSPRTRKICDPQYEAPPLFIPKPAVPVFAKKC